MDRICTIIAFNYMPQAVALLESTRKIYPNVEFYVLITDSTSRAHPFLESATILLPSDLDLPLEWLREMRSYYDPVEFATSVKPFLLSKLLDEGVTTVTFLDPDILLLDNLDEGISAASEYGIALTPHRLTPPNISQPGYNEILFLKYGIFNLGYISVGQKSKPMLAWWGEKLRWFCTRFPDDDVFTDQKWMNFVPAYFDFKVIRNPGYDFAPWNIDERPVTSINGKLYAGESALVFVHFSQMSSDLAAGRILNNWEKLLSGSLESKKSLDLIEKLTIDYSARLVELSRLIVADKDYQPDRVIQPIASFHTRQRWIRQSMKSGLIEKSQNRKSLDKIKMRFPKIAKALERSAMLNGMRRGFRSDLLRLNQRVRNFLHK
jgi:hypothetical protein